MGVIIGTAGHVDHGKTELIKALTGVDTDRLIEEKRRGLTIDLGFAPLDLASCGRVGIIDVPGHVHFLKNMLAGIGSVDLALLVIAADEGVMPQTIEHFQILRLLRVPEVVIVVSKIDLVPLDLLDLVIADINDLLRGTYLEDSPIVKVSARTGEGLEDLKKLLDAVIVQLPQKDSTKTVHLPIDRVFVLKGVGTVVTGSLVSGKISKGEEVVIYPKGIKTRVRQIQVFNESKDEVLAGNRVALNLVGVGKNEIERGDVISKEGAFNPTKLIDAELEILPEVSSLKDWTRVRLHLGSGEVLGRIALLGKNEINGGGQGYCQIKLEKEIAVSFGDRFVIRSYSPLNLLGGGIVLHANPIKHKRHERKVIATLEARAEGNLKGIITAEIAAADCVDKNKLIRSLNVTAPAFDAALNSLEKENVLQILGRYLLANEKLKAIKEDIVKLLRQLHQSYPLKKFVVSKEELKTKFSLESELFDKILSMTNEIEVVGDKVKLKYSSLSFTPAQLKKREEIEKFFLAARFSPPLRQEILQKFDSEVFYSLVEQGVLVKIDGDVFLHKELVDEAKSLIADYIKTHGEMRVSDLRDILNTTRKYAVPIAEYLDSIGFTERVEDKRILVL